MAWPKAVRRAALVRDNYRCAICLKSFASKPRKLILHHTQSRKNGIHTLEVAESRCRPCEGWAHKVSSTGNPTPEQIREKRRSVDEVLITRSCGDRHRPYQAPPTSVSLLSPVA